GCLVLQAEDGIGDRNVTGVQTCPLPICPIVRIGLSEVSGCWKTMAVSRPRIRFVSRSERPRRSRPSNRTDDDGSTLAVVGAIPLDRKSVGEGTSRDSWAHSHREG